MKKNYQTKAASAATVPELVMPEVIGIAMLDIADAAREGLLALAVGAGLQVMHALMAESVTTVCGPKGRHNPDRTAVRHGSDEGSVTLGGRRVPVTRPRVSAVDGATEVPVPAYELFNGTELLDQMTLERMMAKLSTRHYRAGLEPVGTE